MAKTFKDDFNDAIHFVRERSESKIKEISFVIESNRKFVYLLKELLLEVVKSYDFLDGQFHTENITSTGFDTVSFQAERSNTNEISICLRYDPNTLVQVGTTAIPNFKVGTYYDIDAINSILSEEQLEIVLFEQFEADNEGHLSNTSDIMYVDGRDLFVARDKFMGSIPAMVSDVMKRKREKNK